MRSSKFAIILIVVVALLGMVFGFVVMQRVRANSRQVELVVPAGSASRIAAGEQVDVLPATITMTLGLKDNLIIRNDDAQTVQIGPYKIEPGQQFSQQFFNTGTFDMLCSLHSSNRLRIVVVR